MKLRPAKRYAWNCLFVFVLLYGDRITASSLKNIESSPVNSGDVIMHEDAEEEFYKVDLVKYSDLGIKCPEPEPPENGYIVGVETSVGSVVYVQCHQGYRLEGPTPMACIVTDEGAQWDPEVRRVCVEGSTDFDEDTQQNLNMAESAAQGTAPKQINRAAVNSQPSFIKSKAHPSKKHRTEFTEAVREEGEPTAEELEQVPEQCKPKPEAGPCRALFKRFYFNQITMECHTFFYGGCQGNQNNFQSIEECNLTCLPKHE